MLCHSGLMPAYSTDLRQRVVQALQGGQTQSQVAQHFDLSLSSVQRYARKWREQQDLEPRPIPGRARLLSQTQQQELAQLVRSRTDWTLQSLAQAWQQRSDQVVSRATLHRYLHRLDYSYKKEPRGNRVRPPEANRLQARYKPDRSRQPGVLG